MKIEVEGPEPEVKEPHAKWTKDGVMVKQPEEMARMPGLVQIAAALQIGMEYLEASAEDMTMGQFEELAETEEKLHEKIANYGTALKIHRREAEHFRGQAAVIQAMADELKHKAKMIENMADRKKQVLKAVMERFDIPKVKGPHATVYLCDGAEVLKVENEALALEALPPEFIVTARAIDVKPLLEVLKMDETDLEECAAKWGVSIGRNEKSINLR